ncbi:SpoIIE family protein phosphatase [Paracrocinitomix mangrovi]|uniref:SpoIIE family protein phosphatase n=1 Tax=Paracrocinitomix mangrovi TaxID=2862509 RepID=UPI001C8EB2C8|nr:SpoIIE family protein phosphatase [Paracrocinitomix mangrovi]UKN01041.1 SpoIIE family protein phosphatase [Paracrocinitomix mangrovi]
MLKKTSFEKKVIGMLVLVVLAVSCISALVYFNLRQIINEITEEARQDENLIIMKEMVYDLSDAENGVKSYSLTKDPAYLEEFEENSVAVDQKIQKLRELSKGNEESLALVDSLDVLTKNKFVILEDLLILQEQYGVDRVLDQVIQNLEKTGNNKTSNQTINENVATSNNSGSENTTDSNAEKVEEKTAEQKEEDKKGFFKRLKDKWESRKDEESSTEVTTNDTEVNTEESAESSSETQVENTTNQNQTSNNNQINLEERVSRIRERELANEREIKIEELKLIQEDKEIMDQIKGIFDRMEAKENAKLNEQIAKAEDESSFTKNIVLAFCLLVIGMLIFAAYTIYSYVKRNNAYKKALKAAKDETEQRNKEVIDSIHYAQRIQTAILPDKQKFDSCIPDSFVLYKPKDIVAGDFYWMVDLNDTILLAVADCTGHGVPGAMVSVVCHNSLNRSVREFGLTEPAKILEKTRELVIETLDEGNLKVSDGMDICLCSINKKTNMVQYAGANNSLYLLKNEGIHEIKADKQPVGRHITTKPFTNHEIKLSKGDHLYMFTDGMADQFGGPKGKKFKYKQFKDLLVASSKNSVESQRQQINTAFESWRGNLEQIDDVCVVGVRV